MSEVRPMPLKNRDGVEVLKLKDLTGAEIDEAVYELRYQAAELAEYDRVGTGGTALTDKAKERAARPPVLCERPELPLTMSVEDAAAELHRAESEGRLLIEWKLGWLYFFYSPFIRDTDDEFADSDMREFLTRMPRPTKIHRQRHCASLKV